MSEPVSSGAGGALPWSHPLRVADLATRKPTRFALAPEAGPRAALAEDLGILGLPRLAFRGEILPRGRDDWELRGELTAEVVQPCVVTLAPVSTVLAETVVRRYMADLPEPEAEEMEVPEDDSLEPLGAAIDPGAVMAEALALALPLYPRAAGVEAGALLATPPGAEPLDEEKLRPFANLADLMKRRDAPDEEPEGGEG